mmetsp:Transcript_39016/g.112654  ORF Transcript_39016/g.112654 Transcript_39016/m.112654 type:complete len:240 (+) Transcript_39016:120-839(+)
MSRAAFVLASFLLHYLPEADAISLLHSQAWADCPAGCSHAECGQRSLLDSRNMWRPIPQVLAETPGINGFCYYSQFGASWLSGVPQILKSRDTTALLAGAEGQDHQPLGMLATLGYDDVVLTTHLQPSYSGDSYDIPYCHGLGWLRGQRLNISLAADFNTWEALSASECERLRQQQAFTQRELTFEYHKNNRDLTARDFRAHVYAKCLMGSIVTEMAWCHFGIGCLLEDNYVGHGSECE